MLKTILPYLKLYQAYFYSSALGIILSITALASALFLLSLSGWFLAASAYIGVVGLYTFNYMLPAAGVRGLAITRTVARYFERLVNHNITFKMLSDLRTFTFNKIISLSTHQLSGYQKGELLNRFITDIDNLDHLYLRIIVPFISAIFVIFALCFGLSYLNVTVALLFLLTFLLSMLILPISFYRAGYDIGVELAEQRSAYRQQLIHFIQGQAELTVFAAKEKYASQLTAIETKWLWDQKKQAHLMGISRALIIIIVAFLVIASFLFLSEQFSGDDSPFIALFIFSALASAEIFTPIGSAFIYLSQMMASAKRVNQLMETKPSIIFSTFVGKLDTQNIEVKLTNINFTYTNQTIPLFEQLNLTLKANTRTVLIGKTGEGKSTIMNLILREWDPDSGSIQFNSIDIKKMDEQNFRAAISVVPQVITIFSTSLRDNLKIAKNNATDDELINILHAVKLDKLLATNDGLDILLGEKGRQLSGGEKRRIGIARALLHNGSLILLDEPTESLDTNTEQQILALLQKQCQQKTVLMITHKKQSYTDFDHIIQLEQGKLKQIR